MESWMHLVPRVSIKEIKKGWLGGGTAGLYTTVQLDSGDLDAAQEQTLAEPISPC